MPKLTYYGHDAFLLETEKAKIFFDPFLSGNPHATVKPSDVKADYVLVSHGHPDHLGDSVEIAKRNNATIIAPFELAMYCQNLGASVHPMHIGGGYNFPFGRVKLTIAHHGSAFPTDEGMVYTGNPCGFIVNADGKIIYHAGDTGLFYDMKLIGDMYNIDICLIPIGDNFTMGISDAVRAVELLKPGLAIPMHYKTFDVIEADPAEFVNKLKGKNYNAIVLGFGESYEF